MLLVSKDKRIERQKRQDKDHLVQFDSLETGKQGYASFGKQTKPTNRKKNPNPTTFANRSESQ